MHKKRRSVKQNRQTEGTDRRISARTTQLAWAKGRKTKRKRRKEREKSAGALRYSRASDSPRASTCSTCPTFQDLLSCTPNHRARARVYRHTHTYIRWGPYPRSISFLLTREKTTTFSHPHLARCHTAWSLLVAPASDSSSSISSVFERFARGSWENEAGGS